MLTLLLIVFFLLIIFSAQHNKNKMRSSTESLNFNEKSIFKEILIKFKNLISNTIKFKILNVSLYILKCAFSDFSATFTSKKMTG